MQSIKYRLSILIVNLFLLAQPVWAVLDIEIKGGFQSANPIAIAPFTWIEAGKVPVDLARVIQADLARSGVFSPLKFNQLPERPTMDGKVDFSRWKKTDAENLVLGSIKSSGIGQYSIEFKMLDIFTQEEVVGYRYNVKKHNLRRVAHQISDKIYQELTHSRGAFDTLIAYVSVKNSRTPSQRLYTLAVADSDAQNEQSILQSKQPIMSPAWSPNGKRLAYVSFEKKRSLIYVQELSSGKRKIIAQFKGINSAPVWSPDGKRLAMTLSKDGNSEIYVVYIASGVLQRITKHYSIDTEPSWSPDGRSLVFTSDRSGKPQIYQVSINAQGRANVPQRITYKDEYNAGASFSPNGKSLVMITQAEGKYRVAVLNLVSRKKQILTQSSLDESASFSPNGQMILYATELRGRGILEAISIDGTNTPQRLQVINGDVREPAWSPYRH